MEIGCAAGANLMLLRQWLNLIRLVGIDINQKAVKISNDYFQSVGDDKTTCFVKKIIN
jgi:predicted O-methyltransferase YrrM